MFITKQVSIFSLKPVMLEICEATINKHKQKCLHKAIYLVIMFFRGKVFSVIKSDLMLELFILSILCILASITLYCMGSLSIKIFVKCFYIKEVFISLEKKFF